MRKKIIWILDESTAALDYASENQIIRTVKNYREYGNTVLIIAHRKTMLGCCDMVYLMAGQQLIPLQKAHSESLTCPQETIFISLHLGAKITP